MSDGAEPLDSTNADIMSPSHNRILVIMAILGFLGSIAGAGFYSLRFGLGIAFGTFLAFGSYFWLKLSLGRLFAVAAEGKKPKVSGLRFLLRYFTLAAVIAVVYVSDILPIVGVILGLAAFGFAIVVEGFIRIFKFFNAGTGSDK